MKRLIIFPATVGILSFAVLVAVPDHLRVLAQSRTDSPLVAEDSGHVALGLALRKLNVSGTFMQAPAHPDDENNALLAMFAHGMGLRTIDVQNNRGGGGQNEIGPELFRDMAVLRTSELLSAHRIDGAEQYFTRAIDYGYSFDPQEVIGKWGRADIVGDYVRLIRMLRPDVILTMNIQGRGGDRAHEATTILVREAWREAGDASRYPEQIGEGLRPWQAKEVVFHLYRFSAGGAVGEARQGGAGRSGDCERKRDAPRLRYQSSPRSTPRIYDPLLGRTYADIGFEARSNHKCQGMTGLPALPGVPGGRGGPNLIGYQLMESTIPGQMGKDETSLFEGIDTSLSALAQFAGPNPPAALTDRTRCHREGGQARAEGIRRWKRRRHSGANRSRSRGGTGSSRSACFASALPTRRGMRSIFASRSRSATMRMRS